MKTLHVLTASLIAVCGMSLNAAPQSGSISTIPSAPVGILSVSPSVVQVGTYPMVSWNITYPSKISDVATITAPGTITLTQKMHLSVRSVGVGVTESQRGEDSSDIHAEARISINDSSYDQIFYGTNQDVDPSYSLFIKQLQAGTTIDFGGRYVKDGDWTPFYTSKSSNLQVVTLVKGDTVPTRYALHESPNFASYLDPYIDGTGKIDIGPLSMLVVMELAETDHGNTAYDYQDVVLFVTLAEKHPNNGHGNNLDGVDSSNPGQGSGGPNGEVDPSGGYDDEMR